MAGPIGPTWVLVNPVAGGTRALGAWRNIEPLVRERVSDLAVRQTEGPGHATVLAREAVAAGAKRIVIVGGDGTIQEAVAGLVRTDTVLGVIPAGTGNDFSRTHLIPRDHTAALEIALGTALRRVDVGTVNGRPYVNVGGVGFDAEVAAWTKHKTRFVTGPALYVAGVLTQLWAFSPQDLTYRIDDEPPRTERCLLIAVGNGRYYGGGMMMCPDASPNDGWLDIVIGGNLGKGETLRLLTKVFSGAHVTQPKVSQRRARRIEISGSERLSVQADGEPFSRLPALFELIPSSLTVAVPPAAANGLHADTARAEAAEESQHRPPAKAAVG